MCCDPHPRPLRKPPKRVPQHGPPPGGGAVAAVRGRAGGLRRPPGPAGLRRRPRHARDRARGGRAAARRDRAGRRRPHLDPRVQRVDPGRAEERARLGVAPVPRQRPDGASRSRSSARRRACSAPCGRRPRPRRCWGSSAPTCSTASCRWARPGGVRRRRPPGRPGSARRPGRAARRAGRTGGSQGLPGGLTCSMWSPSSSFRCRTRRCAGRARARRRPPQPRADPLRDRAADRGEAASMHLDGRRRPRGGRRQGHAVPPLRRPRRAAARAHPRARAGVPGQPDPRPAAAGPGRAGRASGCTRSASTCCASSTGTRST